MTPTAPLVAASLNAELNNVSIETLNADLLAGPPPDVQTILVGTFLDAGLAKPSCRFWRCREAGIVCSSAISAADLPRGIWWNWRPIGIGVREGAGELY